MKAIEDGTPAADESKPEEAPNLIAGRVAEFEAQRTTREKFVESLKEAIRQRMADAGVEISLVEGRVKSAHSLARHLVGEDRPVPVREDQTGVRVVVLFPQDVDAAVEVLKSMFGSASSVVKDDSDRVRRLEPWEFAYRSHHVKFKPKSVRLAEPVPLEVQDEWLEIQVRTMAEHVWGAIDHKLRYKAPFPLEREDLRALFRTAALLEAVDVELGHIHDRLLETASQDGLYVRAGLYRVGISAKSVRAMLYDCAAVALELAKVTGEGWDLIVRDEDALVDGGPTDAEGASCELLARVALASGLTSIEDLIAHSVAVLSDRVLVGVLVKECQAAGLQTRSHPADLIALLMHVASDCPPEVDLQNWQDTLESARAACAAAKASGE